MRMWKRGWTVRWSVSGFPGAAILALPLTLAGCVQVGPKELVPKPILTPALAPESCALPDLPPLASTVFVDIAPGRPPKADAGGKALVVGYGRAREAIRACREGR